MWGGEAKEIHGGGMMMLVEVISGKKDTRKSSCRNSAVEH